MAQKNSLWQSWVATPTPTPQPLPLFSSVFLITTKNLNIWILCRCFFFHENVALTENEANDSTIVLAKQNASYGTKYRLNIYFLRDCSFLGIGKIISNTGVSWAVPQQTTRKAHLSVTTCCALQTRCLDFSAAISLPHFIFLSQIYLKLRQIRVKAVTPLRSSWVFVPLLLRSHCVCGEHDYRWKVHILAQATALFILSFLHLIYEEKNLTTMKAFVSSVLTTSDD